jgi:hypothetical protein
MTVGYPSADMHLMPGQDRLDTLADALGVSRVRPGGPLPALWHWASTAPACAVRTSVCVRLFRAPQAGLPALLRPPAGTHWDENVQDLVQDQQVRVQTLISRLPDTDPGAPLTACAEKLANNAADTGKLLSLFAADPSGTAVNRALGLLAAHCLRRRVGGQLIAIALHFWSVPESLGSCRRVAWLEREGQAMFRMGAPGEPIALTGTAWFGCGPGPSR